MRVRRRRRGIVSVPAPIPAAVEFTDHAGGSNSWPIIMVLMIATVFMPEVA